MTDMSSDQLQALLEAQTDIVYTKVDGDGKHYTATIVSEVFANQSKVKRQLWVYALLNPYITSGALHAIQLHTWTPTEWQKIRLESGKQE